MVTMIYVPGLYTGGTGNGEHAIPGRLDAAPLH
jgi:hypothetical protein